MDGAYDSIRSYRLLKRMGIKLIIHSLSLEETPGWIEGFLRGLSQS
jgi:hypothetical protein